MQLRFDQLRKQFGDTTAFEIGTLVIESGELFTFAGPAGAGKSTLLNVIAGLESPSSGRLIAGERVLNDVAAVDRDVAVITPSDLLNPGTSAFALFDEPLRDLEPSRHASMIEELRRVHAELGTTFIYATSDQAEALWLSDRIAVLDHGTIDQVGTPTALLERPRTIRVAGFFGDPPMNVVPGILEKDGVAVEIGPRAVQLNGMIEETYARDVFLGVRPEHVRLERKPDTGWRGTVTTVEARHGHTTIGVRVDGGNFVAREEGESPYETGDRVAVSMASRQLHVFDERGVRLEVV